MRQRFDFSEHDEALFRGKFRKSIFSHTLTADNFQIGVNTPPILVIDPDGSKDVRLPDEAVSSGLELLIINNASGAETITVKDTREDATIATIAQGGAAVFWCDGTEGGWFGFSLNSNIAAAGTNLALSGTLTVGGLASSTVGFQPEDTAVTATADGLTTGLIAAGTGFAAVTSANADHIVTLPSGAASEVGQTIKGWVGANGCEMRTPAASNATINGVDADGGAAEMAIPATTLFVATLVAADTWIVMLYDEEGVLLNNGTIGVPDAV